MAQLEIIGVPQSTYTHIARMASEEKGVAYDLKMAAPHTPEVTAIHPFGRIPAMRHGDVTLCESKAIATYIDRTFDGPGLFPDDPAELAACEQWVSLVNTVIDPVMVRTYLFNYIFPKGPDGRPDRQTIDAAVATMRTQMDVLDRAVANGYLAGAGFCYADTNLMPILFYVRQFPEGAELIKSAANLDAYYARHSERPAFRNTTPPPRQN